METEEVIKTLKANYPDAHYEQLREAVDIAISALEKQIPKIPKYYKEEDIFVKNLFKVYAHCPQCGSEIIGNMHCTQCGQAIDWEEE